MSKRNMSEDNGTKAKMSEGDIPGYGISEEKGRRAVGKKRASSLGTCSIFMLRISVTILTVLCAVLLMRIRSLNGTIEALKAQTERLVQIVSAQQELLEQLTGKESSQTGLQGEQGKSGGGTQTGATGANGSAQTGATGAGGEVQEAAGTAQVSAEHKVYLTFDDGPSTNTQDILDILDRYGIKATFFVVGKEGSSAQEAMQRIVEDGHTLGMHSYTHKYGEIYESVESFAADFARQQEYIYDVTGVTSTVYRFPGGSSNALSEVDMREFARYLDSQGVRFFDWNISSHDGGSYLVPVEELVQNCTADIEKFGTSVILMHDAAGKKTTVEALPKIIEAIQAMEDTVLLPITEDTVPVQHISWQKTQE